MPDSSDPDAALETSAAISLLETLGLTSRQAEVLHWIAEGKTNQEIGQILDCSYHTVKNHLKDIFFRLHVNSRTGAAACAYRAHIGRLASATKRRAKKPAD